MFAATQAAAYPDGAPWGAANPADEEHCASCHFEHAPVHESAAIEVSGLPSQLSPDESYALSIELLDDTAISAGFQLIVSAADENPGRISSSAADVEFIGTAIRSTAPLISDRKFAWALQWHTPSVINLPLTLFVAVASANDDGSPFGDTIHFRQVVFQDNSASE
jgi:hypothetical protein